MVSESRATCRWLLQVCPLRRGHDEYPAAAPDPAGMAASRGITALVPAGQVSFSFVRRVDSSCHEELTMERRAIIDVTLTTSLVLLCAAGAGAAEEKAGPAGVEEAFGKFALA